MPDQNPIGRESVFAVRSTPTGVVKRLLASGLLIAATTLAGCGDGTAATSASPQPANIILTPTAVDLLGSGAKVQAGAVVVDQSGNVIPGIPLVWTSSNPSVATVSSGGLVTAFVTGTSTLTVTAGALSASAPILVAATATTTSVANSPRASTFGEVVTLVATVLPPAVSGTVQFLIDGAIAGPPVALLAGVASDTTSAMAAGGTAHLITARFSGDLSHGPSEGTAHHLVARAPTTISVTAASASSGGGGPATIIAEVLPVTATGMVQFMIDGIPTGSPIALVTGLASFTTTALNAPGAPHVVTAVYGGSTNFVASTATLALAVTQRTTITTVTASPTETVSGTPVSLAAAVTPTDAAGTVQFVVNGENLGAPVALVGGRAAHTTSALVPSSVRHVVRAVYGGSATHGPSTGLLGSGVLVSKAASGVTVTWGPGLTGTKFTAAITPATATGTVAFTVNGVSTGPPVTVIQGMAEYTTPVPLPMDAGNKFTAEYGGDENLLPSMARGSTLVVPRVTAITSSANPSALGTSVTFVATVATASGPQTFGFVRFTIDGVGAGPPVPLLAGSASLATASLTLTGTPHVISATWLDADGNGYSVSTGTLNGGQSVVRPPFYVSAVTGSNGNAGTRTRPFKTIQHAIDVAGTTGHGGDVFVASGTYVENITLRDTVSVYGGYRADTWTRGGVMFETNIFGGTTAVYGVGVHALTLDGLTIRSADAPADPTKPGSSVGIRLVNSQNVVITSNVIGAGAGRDGAVTPVTPVQAFPGMPGGDGAQGGFLSPGFGGVPGVREGIFEGVAIPRDGAGGYGGRGCTVAAGYDSPTGSYFCQEIIGPLPPDGTALGPTHAGLPGGWGESVGGSLGGQGGTGGFRHGAQAGTGGINGSAGVRGTSGLGGNRLGILDPGGLYFPSAGLPGARGSTGAGGGGGGGGGNSLLNDAGGGGAGGGGGYGGPGGSGGQGGGGSFALVLVGSSGIAIHSNSFTTDDGGRGASGAEGKVGGPGGVGGKGGLGGEPAGVAVGGEAGGIGANVDVRGAALGGAGGNGGNGGDGGDGGNGGGGGGGPSIGIFEDPLSSSTISGNTYSIGRGGKGGAVNEDSQQSTNSGADGLAAQYVKLSGLAIMGAPQFLRMIPVRP